MCIASCTPEEVPGLGMVGEVPGKPRTGTGGSPWGGSISLRQPSWS